MLRTLSRSLLLLLPLVAGPFLFGHDPERQHPDLTKDPTLYVVGYAHLDTQWRWEYPQTISEYILKTLRDNFALFEKYPNYIFNFTGSVRYRMIKEYYPEDYAKLKEYVAAGRWFPAGSSVEENDANSPSAESLVRQILYGSHFFRREFGQTSAEYMLPDCFGFPASLPSILAHMGIKGFATQKLVWGSAAPVGGPGSPENTPEGIPFNVGIWEGPDGRGVIGALNPGSYGASIRHDLTKSPAPPADPNTRPLVDWPKRVDRNGQVSGLYTDYHYHGTGDTGGAPREESVKLMEAIVTEGTAVLNGTAVKVGDGPLNVLEATTEQMFLDIDPGQSGRLPRYKGDLLLSNHSAGSINSQTYMKELNRKAELLADAAERASVAASWLGGRTYPLQRLNNAWELVLASQMHDIIPGTSTPKAYEYSWNDDILAENQFAAVLTSASEAVASSLDTNTNGTPVVVYNPLQIRREDVVEVKLSSAVAGARVFGPDGKEVAAQVSGGRLLFLADVPSVGYAVYEVRPSSGSRRGPLTVSTSSLENGRYRVRIDDNGDVGSVFDKKLNKELLSAPLRLALQTERPRDWPAWNMDWSDQQKPPRHFVGAPAKVRVVEDGPVRVAVEISREAEGSRFVQTVRLSGGGAGDRVEFRNVIEWKVAAAALKATFPLTASNPMATYNWGVGTIQRENNHPKKFEVPSHFWIDLTDKSGAWGVTVLADTKQGSDKPDDNTLRLTLIYTPGIGDGNGGSFSDQATQDWGHHDFVYGLAGHSGDWRDAESDWQAYRLSQPLVAFESPRHAGPLGKTFSLMSVGNSRVRVMAVKKAEESDEIIVRLVEVDGRPARNVQLSFAAPVVRAREVDGQERPLGSAEIADGKLVAGFTPYQLRTFALTLAARPKQGDAPKWQAVTLPYDRVVSSRDNVKSTAGFAADGRSLAAELVPREIAYGAVQFKLAAAGEGKPDAVTARGQTIALPEGRFNRLYLLAASDGDQTATFRVGDRSFDLRVQNWTGFIGQWDNRTWTRKREQLPPRQDAPPGAPPRFRTQMEYSGLVPGFVKPAPVAWFASHHHTAEGANEPYGYSYLFAYSIPLPADGRTLTLPENDKIRVLAATVSGEGPELRPAQPLYDMIERE